MAPFFISAKKYVWLRFSYQLKNMYGSVLNITTIKE